MTFFTNHTTFHSHDHRTDNLLKESRHDNSRQITVASQVIILSKQFRFDNNKYIAFFTGHTTFHSHDHQTDTLLRESRHDNNRHIRHITVASLAIAILSKQFRFDNNKYIAFFTGHTTFHSHDHQTDTLPRESRHDNNRQITICLTGHKSYPNNYRVYIKVIYSI